MSLLLAAAPALGLAQVAAAADNQITVAVQGGFGGTVPRTGWAPVQVDVTNHGPDRAAILKLSVSGQGGFSGGGFLKGAPIPVPFLSPGPGGGIVRLPFISGGSGSEVTQRLRVVLPAGTTKHFTAYLPVAAGGTWKAEVDTASGASLASAEASVNAASTSLTIAVISDDHAALNQIGAIASLAQAFGGQPQLVHLTPGDLPDNAAALSGFGLVAVTNATTDSLTAAQRQALDDYVAQGGSVLVTGGAAWRTTQAGLPADLVPMAPSGVQSVASLPGLAASLGNPPVPGSVDVATGSRRAGVTDLSEGSLPVLVESTVGRGLALYLTVDPSAEPMASWSGTLPLLRQVVIRGAVAQGPLGGGVAATTGRGLQSQAPSLFQALSNIPSLDLPSPVLIAIALVLFIVLVGPVNYVVLRRTQRPDLAWGTIPLLVVLSAGSIYGLGLKTRGTDLLADRIRLVYLDPSSGRGYVDSGTGVFAPHPGTHGVPTAPGSLVTPMSGNPIAGPRGIMIPFPGFTGTAGALTLDDHNPPDAQMSWPQADTIQAFGEEYAESEQGGLQGELTVVNGRLIGTVLNRLGRPISDAVAISGTAFHTFGAIPPGGSVSIDLPVAAPAPSVVNGGRNPLAQQIYLQASAVCGSNGQPCGTQLPGARPTARQREAQRRSDILSGLMSTDPYSVSHPVFLAWSTTPAAPVRVDGQRAQLNELDAYVLSLQASGTGTSLPAGVAVARPVDSTGSVTVLGGPVSPSFLAPNTTSVFEFALGSTGWTKLSLTEGSAFFGAPGGATVSAAVYNFRTSTWDPITLTTSQSVDIPAPGDHTSPDGLVRLRLQASGVGGSGPGPIGLPAFLGQIDISGDKGPTA